MRSIEAVTLAARLRSACRQRILVVGSLNVDVILYADGEPADDGAAVLRSESRVPGGHAGNCAAALAALGSRVALLGAVGADPDGDLLVEDLRRRGVDTTPIRRDVGVATGVAYIPVFGARHFMLLSRGVNETLTAADVRTALATGFDAVMLSDPSREATTEIVRTVHSMRPRPLLCWTPGGVVAREPAAAHILPRCDVVFVNRAERDHLSRWTPEIGGADGPEIVTTLGKDGAITRSGGRCWRAAGRDVTAVDPTGAGDAFAASYLLGLLAGVDPATRLALANAAGALAVTAPGARGRLATIAEIVDG